MVEEGYAEVGIQKLYVKIAAVTIHHISTSFAQHDPKGGERTMTVIISQNGFRKSPDWWAGRLATCLQGVYHVLANELIFARSQYKVCTRIKLVRIISTPRLAIEQLPA